MVQPFSLDELTPQEILKLITDILDACEDAQGNPPDIINSGDVLFVDFGNNKRFRIFCQDASRFN